MVKTVLLTLLLITPSAIAQQTRGQRAGRQPAGESSSDSTTVRVYALKYMRAGDIAETLRNATYLTVIAEERTNSLIVQANDDRHAMMQNLIGELDKPTNASDLVTIVPIRNRNPKDVASRIQELYRNPNDLMVSADIPGHRMLLRGNQAAIESAERMVGELDKPLPSATVHFAFFQLNETGAKPELIGPIPPDLQDVAEELLRFGSPRLIGRTMTASVENEEFQVAGQVAEQSMVEVNCRLTSAAENGAVVMQIRAELALEKPEEENEEVADAAEAPRAQRMARAQMRRGRSRDFSIATTVLAPRGEYVILGGAPHGFEPGQSVVLVVHVPK